MVRAIKEEVGRHIDVDALIAGMRWELEAGESIPVAAAPGGKELLARVRTEVARRKLQAAVTTEAGTADAIEWLPTQPRMQAQREYVLGELLAFDDEDFVTNAYLAVLRRPPDPAGFAAALHALREGKSKVVLLGALRWSPEGITRGVHIDGLLLPYTLQRWEQKRFVGMAIAWLHGLLKLGIMGHRQRVAEARQAHETHELGRLLNRLAAVEAKARHDENRELKQLALDIQRRHGELAGQIEAAVSELAQEFRQTKCELGELAQEFHHAKSELGELAQELHHAKSELGEVAQEFYRAKSELGEMKGVLATIRSAVDAAELRLFQLGKLEEDSRNQKAATLRAENFSRSLDPLYSDFEDAFRGSKEIIRRRVAPYLDWVQEGGEIGVDAPILDIGCGRGEWIELAREHGMQVRGIDLNRTFVESCREIGLDVIEGDAIRVLRTMPDGSVGAVTSMHLVEHLPFEVLIQLLDEAFRVLRPGGVIALETPNPENLSVSSHWFFLDPTHRNPLPPVTLAWLVRQRGFVDPRIERLTTARDLGAPPLLPTELPGAASVNVLLERLGAAADYSIVARKPNV